ncbi:type VI secretion system protein TssL [Rhodovarius crocodyli]|uniref:Type VI secretion system protein TssL n=1 Tax=Rhodovarius crocodyli TaxID=1979269 RepID=A0A437MMF2_9PROT|nr:type VI secretion system protein TssL, long form [Rhodovarius crocodyli]RVT98815.1 type VI secretion system protein TssL [Rhodovarius crocodyli]
MSDNPFDEEGDADKTVVGRQGIPARDPGQGLHSMGTPPPRPMAQQPMAPPPPSGPAPRLGGEAGLVPLVGIVPLAAAAAPLLEILSRLVQAGPNASINANELRERTMRALRQFEADATGVGATAEDIRAAHYVICAALDDVVLGTNWGATSAWASHSLVSTLHGEVRSGERVFDLLGNMQKDPGRFRGALEVMYLAISLGLQGKYRLMQRGPAELERVREGLYELLRQLRGEYERELSPRWRGVDAPHRGPSRQVPGWVGLVLAAFLLGGGWYYVASSLSASSEDLYERMAALPPGALPAIDRSAPPVPPAPPPPPPPPPPNTPPRPDALATMRQFLAPEIQQNLVTVEGDAQRILVRIKGAGMFPSASATLDPRFHDLMRRIGEALKIEPGRVQVLGHSDNQPIRSARFPTNFALSQARAEAAMAMIVAANGQPQRFTAQGKADSDPVASNATAEGREQNRRIEVVLLREAR